MNVEVYKDSIIQVKSDAVVSPGNSFLKPGGGTSKEIFLGAGEEMKKEAEELRKLYYPEGIDIGDVVVTNAYNLPFRYVFHTVGPIYGKDDLENIRDCYYNLLEKAEEKELSSITMPGISLGVFGVPPDIVADYAKEVIDNFNFSSLKTIRFVLAKEKDYRTFLKRFE